MRATRLVSLLLLLQTRGALTAEELAAELGVSVRTIHRDAEALRDAGIPIHGERGPAGGYRLPGGYRTRLTGLTPGEAEALFVSAPANHLGIGGVLADAQLKLLAALPPRLRERADRAAQLFHVDDREWWGRSSPPPLLPEVAGALWDGRRLRIRHRGHDRTVDPLGLVLKRGAWYLVAATDRGLRTFRVWRIEAAEALDEPAERPVDFDLASFWEAWSREFEASLPLVDVRVRVRPDALGALRSAVDVRARDDVPRTAPGDEPLVLTVRFERLEFAEIELRKLGADVEVLAPAELRRRMVAGAARLAELYAVAETRRVRAEAA
ncbi:MAG TPA: WYL domain-containing protein [Capillimicrobium sp.]|nr:WYL domain-containing protein [Capillimicrobium sp.]